MIPKLHKNPYGYRFITSAQNTTLQPLCEVLHKILKLLKKCFKAYCSKIRERKHINCYWAIDSSFELLNKISLSNSIHTNRQIYTYDFSTLFTSLPHETVKKEIFFLLDLLFRQKYVVVTQDSAFFYQ